jgi:predicted Zn-dependent protease
LNKAIAAMGAERNDSASYFANLSLQVAGSDPRPWNVLSSVYQKQNKTDSAMIAMEKVIALSGSDTLFTKVKQQSRYNLAVISLTRAETEAAGPKKDAEIKAARALLEAYLKDTPGDANAAQALGRAVRLSGDTAAVTAIFVDMLTAPEKFSADQLFEAASNAAATGHDPDAAKLFENGLKKNPYHRVALLNYANVLFTLKDTERMGPVVTRLVSVDPNYDRAYRLMANCEPGPMRMRRRRSRPTIQSSSTSTSRPRPTRGSTSRWPRNPGTRIQCRARSATRAVRRPRGR